MKALLNRLFDYGQLTRDQVKEKMKAASSNYPSPSGQFGWGIVNGAAAVDLVP